MAITLWSLALQAKAMVAGLLGAGVADGTQMINGVVAIVLALLAGSLVVQGGRALLAPAVPSR